MNATSVPHVTMLHDRILCDNPSMMHQVLRFFSQFERYDTIIADIFPYQASPLHPLEHMQKNYPAAQLQRQVRSRS